MIEEISSIDKEIIDILQKDSKTKLHAISQKMHIPASTIHFHIQKLEREGIIEYTIKKNYLKLGKTIKANISIFVDPKELRLLKKTQQSVAKDILKIKDVESVDVVTGEGDLLAVARVSTIDELNKLVLGKIQTLDGIKNTKTMIVLEELNKN